MNCETCSCRQLIGFDMMGHICFIFHKTITIFIILFKYVINILIFFPFLLFCAISQANFNHKIFECLNPSGEILAGTTANIEWVFSPLEAKTYMVSLG